MAIFGITDKLCWEMARIDGKHIMDAWSARSTELMKLRVLLKQTEMEIRLLQNAIESKTKALSDDFIETRIYSKRWAPLEEGVHAYLHDTIDVLECVNGVKVPITVHLSPVPSHPNELSFDASTFQLHLDSNSGLTISGAVDGINEDASLEYSLGNTEKERVLQRVMAEGPDAVAVFLCKMPYELMTSSEAYLAIKELRAIPTVFVIVVPLQL